MHLDNDNFGTYNRGQRDIGNCSAQSSGTYNTSTSLGLSDRRASVSAFGNGNSNSNRADQQEQQQQPSPALTQCESPPEIDGAKKYEDDLNSIQNEIVIGQQQQQQQQHQEPLTIALSTNDPDNMQQQQQQLSDDTEKYDEDSVGEEWCAAHPGQRNDLWCEQCQRVVCSRCRMARCRSHSVMKLLVAYDDTFNAIEAQQVALVRNLTETRQRNALLDAATVDLHESYENAVEYLKQQVNEETDRVANAFEEEQAKLDRDKAVCGEWRQRLDTAIKRVQTMVDELSPVQAVMQKDRMIKLMDHAAQSRPAEWRDQRDTTQLVEQLRPAWQFVNLQVTNVRELGRKRGHVKVVGEPFWAYGAKWVIEARRGRDSVGEPRLEITVCCVDGLQEQAASFITSVHLAGAEQPHRQTYCDEWRKEASHIFAVCTLSELKDERSVTVRVGVCPSSYRALSTAQADQIKTLEQRIHDLEKEKAERQDEKGVMVEQSTNVNRRRKSESTVNYHLSSSTTTEVRRPKRLHRIVKHPAVTADNVATTTPTVATAADVSKRRSSALHMLSPSNLDKKIKSPPPLSPPPSFGKIYGEEQSRAASASTSHITPAEERASGTEHRRVASLIVTSPTRPEIPPPHTYTFKAPAHHSFLQMDDEDGEAESVSSKSSTVLRRMSGWMKNREGSFSLQAKRMKQQLAKGSGSSSNSSFAVANKDIDDWTFLDHDVALSPGFHRTLEGRMGRDEGVKARRPSAPSPEPNSPAENVEEEDGFEFDGLADIEREQAKVDARLTEEADLQTRVDAINQQLDALQVIANTMDNSKDGYTESNLRRVSSEMGIVLDGRRRRLEEAQTSRSNAGAKGKRTRADTVSGSTTTGSGNKTTGKAEPVAPPRRTASVDPAEIRRAISRVGLDSTSSSSNNNSGGENEENSSNANDRRVSGMSATSSASSSSEGYASSSNGKANSPRKAKFRRNSINDSSSETAALLTPKSNRSGGILKAGRSIRRAEKLDSVQESPLLVPDEDEWHQPKKKKPAATKKRVHFADDKKTMEGIWECAPLAAQSIEERMNQQEEGEEDTTIFGRDDLSDRSEDMISMEFDEDVGSKLVLFPAEEEDEEGHNGIATTYERPPVPPPTIPIVGTSGEIGKRCRCSNELVQGPNVWSTQSSPAARALVAGSNISTPMSSVDEGVVVFGEGQIPGIACGYDTSYHQNADGK